MDPKDCLFCQMVIGKIPTKKVYEDDHTYAFLDINPRNPGHTLVVPKSHAETIFDLGTQEAGMLFQTVQKISGKIMNGVQAQGISIAQNNGQAAGQVVSHVHIHVIPRFTNEGPMSLEAILQVKKMDEQSLDKIVSAIQSASGESQVSSQPESREERREEPRPEPAPQQKKEQSKDDEDDYGNVGDLDFDDDDDDIKF